MATELEQARAPPERSVKHAWEILAHEDAVLKINPGYWQVLNWRGNHRIGVVQHGQKWVCRSDKTDTCCHGLCTLRGRLEGGLGAACEV